jgi:hypothetical protein
MLAGRLLITVLITVPKTLVRTRFGTRSCADRSLPGFLSRRCLPIRTRRVPIGFPWRSNQTRREAAAAEP